jgi:putative endonuclease
MAGRVRRPHRGCGETSPCARDARRPQLYLRRMTVARQRLGRCAEDAVAQMLGKRGWKVLARNARTRFGELDLVCLEGDALVFVEVKAGRVGSSGGPGRPVLAVGFAKQRRIRVLARAWLASEPRLPRFAEIRFDAVGVSFDRGGNLLGVDHIRDAF